MKPLPLLPLNEENFWEIAWAQNPHWFSSDVSDVLDQKILEWSEADKETVKVVFESSETDPDSGYENNYKFHCIMKFDAKAGWYLDDYKVDG